jgi:hypothetical protein
MALKHNRIAKAGFIISMVGTFLCWVPFAGVILLGLGFIFSFIGLILCFTGRRGIGFSVTGLVLSSTMLILLFTVILSYFEKYPIINF